MKNKIILESLASDLKRVALGLHRGSFKMAQRFRDESLKRSREVDISDLPEYMQSILFQVKQSLQNIHSCRAAEDALMYSTLIQNYVGTICRKGNSSLLPQN